VVNIVCVGEGARNHPRRGYPSGACTLAGASARVRRIELRDSAFRSAQKSVKRAARVNVPARSRRGHADVLIESALTGTRARARDVERGEATIGSPQITVSHNARVNIESRNHPRRRDAIDACHYSAQTRASVGARSVEFGKAPIGGPEEPVNYVVRVVIDARNGSGRG